MESFLEGEQTRIHPEKSQHVLNAKALAFRVQPH